MSDFETKPIHSQPSYDAVIPAPVRYDPRLKRHGDIKCLYGEIRSLCGREGYCWASNEYFSETFGTSTRTITRWIGLLEKCGHITAYYEKNGMKQLRKIYLGNDVQKSFAARHGRLSRVDTDVYHGSTRTSNNKENREEENREDDLCKEGAATRSVQKSVSIKETFSDSEQKVNTYCEKSRWKHSESQKARMISLVDSGIKSSLDTLSYWTRRYPNEMFDIALEFMEKERKRGIKIKNSAAFLRQILEGNIVPEVGTIAKNMSVVRMYQANDWPSLIVEKQYVKDMTFSSSEINLMLDTSAFAKALDALFQRHLEHKQYSNQWK